MGGERSYIEERTAVHLHVTGPNARVNIGSQDFSVNIVHTAEFHAEAETEADALQLEWADNIVLRLLCEKAVDTDRYRVAPHELRDTAMSLGVDEDAIQDALEMLASIGYIHEQAGLSLVLISSVALDEYFEAVYGDSDQFALNVAQTLASDGLETTGEIAEHLNAPPLRVWHVLNLLEANCFIKTIQSRIDAGATVSEVRAPLKRWIAGQMRGS